MPTASVVDVVVVIAVAVVIVDVPVPSPSVNNAAAGSIVVSRLLCSVTANGRNEVGTSLTVRECCCCCCCCCCCEDGMNAMVLETSKFYETNAALPLKDNLTT